ncbi:hypothetical protein QUW15_03690 [Desulfovibrio piger]|nr:hypothetical protein [Desulfovibrio piger]
MLFYFLKYSLKQPFFLKQSLYLKRNCATFINRDVTSAREFALSKRPPLPQIFPPVPLRREGFPTAEGTNAGHVRSHVISYLGTSTGCTKTSSGRNAMTTQNNPIVALLEEQLPPIIARKDVARLTFGLVSAKTMANRDSLGTGPQERFRVGKEIWYHKKHFIEFILKQIVHL